MRRAAAMAVALAVALMLAALTPAAAQAPIALPPFAFELPPGFARSAESPNAVRLRDIDGGELSADVYPGVHPLRGRDAAEITDALERPLAATLLPEGFVWLEAPRTEIRGDGLAVFVALAARRNPRGDFALQAVLYAIGPDAALHVGYAGVGQPAAARGTIAAITRSLRVTR